jgi:segregation and condensation protein B
MYGTTKYFLQHFGLCDLAELPPLREIKELGDAAQVLLPDGDGPLEIGENGTMHEGADFVEAVSSKPAE